MLKKRAVPLLLALLLLLAPARLSLAESAKTLSDYPGFVQLPLVRQGSTYTCGIACLHSLLRWASYDMDINDEYLMESCGTTQENGTSYKRILQYLVETGLFDASWNEGVTIEQLKSVIDQGGCVMMPLQAWEFKQAADGGQASFDTQDYADFWIGGHWVVACGYNESSVLFMDPSTAGCYTQMPTDALDVRWHDSPDFVSPDQPFEKLEHCGLIVYCLNGATYDSAVVTPLL